jgi:tetratricopeptide (TPR) repeat protein
MKRTLAALFVAILCSAAAASQSAAPQSPEAAEAARLGEQVMSLYNQGKLDEAAPAAERAVLAWEKAAGAEHPEVVSALYNLGLIRIGQGRLAEAEQPLRKALAICEKGPAATRDLLGKVLGGLAIARAKQGHADEAAKLARRSVEAVEGALGAEHVELADYLRILADIQQRRGEMGEAERLYLRAIRLWAKAGAAWEGRMEAVADNLVCMAARGGYERQKDIGILMEEAAGRELTAGAVLNRKAIYKPVTSYPKSALAGLVQGTVVIKVWADEGGAILKVQPLCGPPLLAEASAKSAAQARLKPTERGGKPVPVSGYLTYRFTLK